MPLVTLTTLPPPSVLGVMLGDETAWNCATRAVETVLQQSSCSEPFQLWMHVVVKHQTQLERAEFLLRNSRWNENCVGRQNLHWCCWSTGHSIKPCLFAPVCNSISCSKACLIRTDFICQTPMLYVNAHPNTIQCNTFYPPNISRPWNPAK